MHLLRMPKTSENMAEGTIGRWLVQEGDAVRAGQPVVELITDKAEFELESEQDGVLRKAVSPENSTVPVNYVIGLVGEAGEALPDVDAINAEALEQARAMLAAAAPASGTSSAASSRRRRTRSGGSVRATPAARRLAKEHGVDLARVREARNVLGAVSEKDVRAFLDASRSDGNGANGGIVGVGTDLVEVDRIAAMMERHGERFLQRVFTAEEIGFCQRRKRASVHFAGRFAVKEAVFKALGTGWGQGVGWRQVETLSEPSGRPRIALSGRADEVAKQLLVRTLHVSISHTDRHAIAYVILEA